MQLSAEEHKAVEKIRRKQNKARRTRYMMLIVVAANVLLLLKFVWTISNATDLLKTIIDADSDYPEFYLAGAILMMSALFTCLMVLLISLLAATCVLIQNWNGNPTEKLILRVIDELNSDNTKQD